MSYNPGNFTHFSLILVQNLSYKREQSGFFFLIKKNNKIQIEKKKAH